MFIFAEEKRPKLQQERPDLSDSELTRFLARMWNELPDKKKVTSKLIVVLYCRRYVKAAKQCSYVQLHFQFRNLKITLLLYLGEVQTPRNSLEGRVREEGKGGS